MRLLVFGLGYAGQALARRMMDEGWAVSGTCRSQADRAEAEALGIEPIDAGDGPALDGAASAAQAILVTSPPDAEGCPGLRALAPALARTHAFPDWIGYLSSTGVYGDRQGGWVNEDSPLNALSPEGARRVAAERDWLEIGRGMGLTVCIFRCAGIYGPGRSAIDRVRAGTARRLKLAGHVVSRVHVDDLAAALQASVRSPRAGGVYNVCDDEPASMSTVTVHAAALLRAEPPPEQPYDPERSPSGLRRFHAEHRRISNARIKAELGWRPAYPSYREGLAAVLAAEGGA